MPAVEIDHLNHAYKTRSGDKRVVLQGLTFSVLEGEIFGLLGPNGGGKTTLFKILTTLLKPSGGRALIGGTDVAANPAQARQKIGVVFQNPSFDRKLTLLENLKHQGRLYGLDSSTIQTRSRLLLESFHLSDRGDDLVEHLSGGLQRRGEIAKGLLHEPKILLMDEPSSGLDPGARRELWTLLLSLKKRGLTILLTTHMAEEGDRCDRLAILNHGAVVALGTPDELKKRIGGDVISIHTKDPVSAAQQIKEKFGGTPTVLDGMVRLEKSDGHAFVPALVGALPGLVEAITVGKPTLEDVFVHETGQRFWNHD